jgi:hypothetical protein
VDDDLTVLAREAYAAYGNSTGWKNFQGNPMPPFDELGDTIQQAWIAAAERIADVVRAQL